MAEERGETNVCRSTRGHQDSPIPAARVIARKRSRTCAAVSAVPSGWTNTSPQSW
jgi:hypothetical protein